MSRCCCCEQVLEFARQGSLSANDMADYHIFLVASETFLEKRKVQPTAQTPAPAPAPALAQTLVPTPTLALAVTSTPALSSPTPSLTPNPTPALPQLHPDPRPLCRQVQIAHQWQLTQAHARAGGRNQAAHEEKLERLRAAESRFNQEVAHMHMHAHMHTPSTGARASASASACTASRGVRGDTTTPRPTHPCPHQAHMHGKEKDWLRALPAYQQACHLVRDSGEFKFDASGTPYNVKEQQAEEEQHGQSALARSSPRAHPPLQTRLLRATLWARGECPRRVDATVGGLCPGLRSAHRRLHCL